MLLWVYVGMVYHASLSQLWGGGGGERVGGVYTCVWEISTTSSDRMSILSHQLDRVLVCENVVIM